MMLKDDEYDACKEEYDVEIVGAVIVIGSFFVYVLDLSC